MERVRDLKKKNRVEKKIRQKHIMAMEEERCLTQNLNYICEIELKYKPKK